MVRAIRAEYLGGKCDRATASVVTGRLKLRQMRHARLKFGRRYFRKSRNCQPLGGSCEDKEHGSLRPIANKAGTGCLPFARVHLRLRLGVMARSPSAGKNPPPHPTATHPAARRRPSAPPAPSPRYAEACAGKPPKQRVGLMGRNARALAILTPIANAVLGFRISSRLPQRGGRNQRRQIWTYRGTSLRYIAWRSGPRRPITTHSGGPSRRVRLSPGRRGLPCNKGRSAHAALYPGPNTKRPLCATQKRCLRIF